MAKMKSLKDTLAPKLAQRKKALDKAEMRGLRQQVELNTTLTVIATLDAEIAQLEAMSAPELPRNPSGNHITPFSAVSAAITQAGTPDQPRDADGKFRKEEHHETERH